MRQNWRPKKNCRIYSRQSRKPKKILTNALANTQQDINDSIDFSAKSATEIANKAKSDFQVPADIAKKIATEANEKIGGAANEFSLKEAAINRSLYDMSGQLTTGFNSRAGNPLQPNLETMSEKTTQLIENSAAKAQAAINQVKQPTLNELEKAQAQIELAKQQINELKRQVEDNARKAAELPATAINQASEFAAEAVAKPIDHVARLNFPIPPTSASNQNSYPAQASMSPPRNFSPMQLNPVPLNSNDAGQSPNNQLRSPSSYSAQPADDGLQRQPVQQPVNAYPSTPHSSFSNSLSGHTATDGNVQPAGLLSPTINRATQFDSSDDQSSVVQASGTSPKLMATSKPLSPAAHVSEIEIPAAVLRGSGSFAPGTVNQLTPVK